MEIRATEKTDIAKIRKLAFSTFVSFREKFHFVSTLLFRKSIFEFKTALVNDEFAGFISAIPLRDGWHIAYVATHPNYKRVGIATRLVEEAEKSVLAKNGSVVIIHVRESNTGAQSLYNRLGYKETTRREKYYPTREGEKETAIIMKKYI